MQLNAKYTCPACADGVYSVKAKGYVLEWLEKHLDEATDVSWHIILCHAPLLAHNPQRAENDHPYLNKDIKLGRIINAHNNIIFISGHTHFSPNDYHGCVEFDDERNNVFINDGSTCPTTSKWREDAIVPDEWCDGVYVELAVSDNEIKVIYYTVESGKTVARGIYQKIRDDINENSSIGR